MYAKNLVADQVLVIVDVLPQVVERFHPERKIVDFFQKKSD